MRSEMMHWPVRSAGPGGPFVLLGNAARKYCIGQADREPPSGGRDATWMKRIPTSAGDVGKGHSSMLENLDTWKPLYSSEPSNLGKSTLGCEVSVWNSGRSPALCIRGGLSNKNFHALAFATSCRAV